MTVNHYAEEMADFTLGLLSKLPLEEREARIRALEDAAASLGTYSQEPRTGTQERFAAIHRGEPDPADIAGHTTVGPDAVQAWAEAKRAMDEAKKAAELKKAEADAAEAIFARWDSLLRRLGD